MKEKVKARLRKSRLLAPSGRGGEFTQPSLTFTRKIWCSLAFLLTLLSALEVRRCVRFFIRVPRKSNKSIDAVRPFFVRMTVRICYWLRNRRYLVAPSLLWTPPPPNPDY